MAFVSVALLGGALAGIASYLLLERPMLRLRHRFDPPNGTTVVAG